MLLPYASDRAVGRRPIATWLLIALLLALTGFVRSRGGAGAYDLLRLVGIRPGSVQVWTLLTYPFFHESWGHVLVNVLYLWVFGGGVEEALGPLRFMLVFSASGAIGGLLQYAVVRLLFPDPAAAAPIVGASAACAGLIGVFAVRYYRARLSFVGLPLRPHVVTVVGLFLAAEIAEGMWDLAHSSGAGGIAHWAHVGGFVFGLAWAQAARLDAQGYAAYQDADATSASAAPGAAIRRLEDLVDRMPDDVDASGRLARAWAALGDGEQAYQHFVRAIRLALRRRRRSLAAELYMESRAVVRAGDPAQRAFGAAELSQIASALEDAGFHEAAADAYARTAVTYPGSAEGEVGLLKAAQIDIFRLDRRSEAIVLLDLYADQYPQSAWKQKAAELRRAATA